MTNQQGLIAEACALSAQNERAAFEAWVLTQWPGAPLSHVRDALPKSDPRYGEYCNEHLQRCWVGWQARAALSPARENVREWIPVSERLPADSRDVLVYCSDTDEHMVGSSMGCGRFAFAFSERGTRICCKPSHWRYIDECDKPAAIAASTGQEGGKA